ncbi:MAG TPA: VOC family protein [Caulobacteraceae bacterium]|jgi:predicted 3-demethylubiquinone-9 3-methyltransferase (glyoxalase superfamily)
MTRVLQHLWFEKDMEAAVRFYVSIVPDSQVHWISAVPTDNPSGAADAVKIIAFTLAGQNYQAIEAGPLDPFNRSFSIVVECDTQAEIDRLWDALTECGSPSQCGWLRDQWGLSWQIVPARLGELMNHPNRAKAKRAAEAMLKMSKFDIAALEAAAGP